MAQAMQNPLPALGQAMQNDERMQKVMEYINQHGGDAQQAFFAYAKEIGADPMKTLSQAQSMMNPNWR